jgi:hypothetical protein
LVFLLTDLLIGHLGAYMYLTISIKSYSVRGFSLVATVMLATLMIVVLLGLISLSNLEIRSSQHEVHQAAARANARMALMIAMGELQKYTGPDQRVTARAVILEGEDPENRIANRNWLGVWPTTYHYEGVDWPLIGKASEDLESTPYLTQGAYQDLRHCIPSLSMGQWKQKGVMTWLVSKRGERIHPKNDLNERGDNVVRLVGRGTLGAAMSADDFKHAEVLVETIQIHGEDLNGAYAWYISDNNQKANLTPHHKIDHVEAALEAAPGFDAALVARSDGELPYKHLKKNLYPHRDKIISYASASLDKVVDRNCREALKHDYHHFTIYSPGIFTNTMMGGLRRDLSSLLLAQSGSERVDLSYHDMPKPLFFSSSYPIIPGPEHGVLGPSFGALRNWAQHMYSELEYAEATFDNQAVRMRPTEHWPHDVSDGACADAMKWAEMAPKIHPVMTECRWHYYFSHQDHRIRTHIIPRVCLWNPYNKELKTRELSVVMPNPYYGVKHGMHFFAEKAHVEVDLKAQNIGVFDQWIEKSGYAGGKVYKIRTNPFPQRRYLAFTLEPATLAAGECQVFSPKARGDFSAGGINIQRYEVDAVSNNVLSPHVIQGTHHFFYDHESSVSYEIQTPKWTNIKPHLDRIDFGRIFDYQPALDLQSDGKVESFPFMLKLGEAAFLEDLYSSIKHPTIQLVNNGAGGVKPTKTFHRNGLYWGSANQKDLSFGNLQSFAEAPIKNAPHTHQVGAKLLWLNESVGEADRANRSPHRHGTATNPRWGEDHMVYNVCPVANWNVRAQMVSRSPASQCANKWYMSSMGPWLLQFVPQRPLDVHDMPAPTVNGFVKNPFGLAIDFSFFPNVVLFDFPARDYGVISLASLRHAMLSPYSWTPSYVVAHSLRDMHSSAEATAHTEATAIRSDSEGTSRWDFLLGKAAGEISSHGARCITSDSQGLLQIGKHSVIRRTGDVEHTSANEVLAYDIAYEVNHNLWDDYFFSSMPLDQTGGRFVWDPEKGVHLWNRRYQYNRDCDLSQHQVMNLLLSEKGWNDVFWRSAEFIKNSSAFNINSTSVQAWTAFLSGTLGIERPLKIGSGNKNQVSFARYRQPKDLAGTVTAATNQAGGWMGARQLTADEVRNLATHIVDEVKKRGPFVSIADFVNRRLVSDQDEASKMGAIDAAIATCGLNENFEQHGSQLSTSVNTAPSSDAPDNNMEIFRKGYRYHSDNLWNTVQPKSKAWGMPGFLTQGDILQSLAPFLAARGDTFTIRAYGESSVNGVVHARAWLEAAVERTPHYVERKLSDISRTGGNGPLEAAMTVNQADGNYVRAELNSVNASLGRKYKLKTFRWLQREEI